MKLKCRRLLLGVEGRPVVLKAREMSINQNQNKRKWFDRKWKLRATFKGRLYLLMLTLHRVTDRHLPYGITECLYLPSDRSGSAQLKLQPSRPVFDLPIREGWKAELF